MSQAALERRVAHNDLGVAPRDRRSAPGTTELNIGSPIVGKPAVTARAARSAGRVVFLTQGNVVPTPRGCRPTITWFSARRIGDFAEWLSPNWRVEDGSRDCQPPRAPMRTHLVQEHPSLVRTGTPARTRSGSLLEVIAINLAWPLGLARFVQGLMTEQPVHAVEGLAFFLLVFFYVLVRLYQLRRTD